MPTDLQPSPHHGHGSSKYKARSINSPVGRRLSDCTIIEDAEETNMEIEGTDRQRIGPGKLKNGILILNFVHQSFSRCHGLFFMSVRI